MTNISKMEAPKFIPDKIVTEKSVNESICEAETDTHEIFLKTGNWTMVHEQPVEANAISVFELNSTKTDIIYSSSDDESIPEVTVTADMIVDKIVDMIVNMIDLLVEIFTKIVDTQSSNCLYTLEKCLKFFRHLKYVFDTNIPITIEMLKIEIINLQFIVEKFESVKMELEIVMKKVIDLTPSHSVMKPGLEKKILENMEPVNINTSTLYQSFITIIEMLEVIVDGMTMKKSEEYTQKSNSDGDNE